MFGSLILIFVVWARWLASVLVLGALACPRSHFGRAGLPAFSFWARWLAGVLVLGALALQVTRRTILGAGLCAVLCRTVCRANCEI